MVIAQLVLLSSSGLAMEHYVNPVLLNVQSVLIKQDPVQHAKQIQHSQVIIAFVTLVLLMQETTPVSHARMYNKARISLNAKPVILDAKIVQIKKAFAPNVKLII